MGRVGEELCRRRKSWRDHEAVCRELCWRGCGLLWRDGRLLHLVHLVNEKVSKVSSDVIGGVMRACFAVLRRSFLWEVRIVVI